MNQTSPTFTAEETNAIFHAIPGLRNLLATQARALGVGIGVLRHGTPVANDLRCIFFQPFCEIVRSSREGLAACLECDAAACQRNTQTPFRKNIRDYERYRCHMHLIDLPASVYLKDRYLADLFMGQIRTHATSKRQVTFLKRRFGELRLAEAGRDLRDFVAAYDAIPLRTVSKAREIDRRPDKVCIAIQLLRHRFGPQLRGVPLSFLRFIANTDFRYGVRSIAHLIDSIPHKKDVRVLHVGDITLQLDSPQAVKASSLAYHILHEDQALGVANAWKGVSRDARIVPVWSPFMEYVSSRHMPEDIEMMVRYVLRRVIDEVQSMKRSAGHERTGRKAKSRARTASNKASHRIGSPRRSAKR